MDVFVGEIRAVGFNFAPQGWAFCDGQLMQIAQNTALFSILGTNYGGNGTTTFALPDLRGATPIAAGAGPGLSSYALGQTGGEEAVTLTDDQLPAHIHRIKATTAAGTSNVPGGRILAKTSSGNRAYGGTPDVQMDVEMVSEVGGGQPHNNLAPFVTLNFIIALQGLFPPHQ